MTKENKEFPQTELQAKILDFWSVRGYEEVHAILGNLNVSFKRKPRYAHLGLDYTYLKQFWKQAQEEVLTKVENMFANEMNAEDIHRSITDMKEELEDSNK